MDKTEKQTMYLVFFFLFVLAGFVTAWQRDDKEIKYVPKTQIEFELPKNFKTL